MIVKKVEEQNDERWVLMLDDEDDDRPYVLDRRQVEAGIRKFDENLKQKQQHERESWWTAAFLESSSLVLDINH